MVILMGAWENRALDLPPLWSGTGIPRRKKKYDATQVQEIGVHVTSSRDKRTRVCFGGGTTNYDQSSRKRDNFKLPVAK